MMSGTLAYMSPEVLLQQAPDGRADIFSLGVVFYEVLTGHHPFLADGFVVALANPGFLLGSLGYSVGDLGGWGAALLWGISAIVAVFINIIYTRSTCGGRCGWNRQ